MDPLPGKPAFPSLSPPVCCWPWRSDPLATSSLTHQMAVRTAPAPRVSRGVRDIEGKLMASTKLDAFVASPSPPSSEVTLKSSEGQCTHPFKTHTLAPAVNSITPGAGGTSGLREQGRNVSSCVAQNATWYRNVDAGMWTSGHFQKRRRSPSRQQRGLLAGVGCTLACALSTLLFSEGPCVLPLQQAHM